MHLLYFVISLNALIISKKCGIKSQMPLQSPLLRSTASKQSIFYFKKRIWNNIIVSTPSQHPYQPISRYIYNSSYYS